MSLSNSAWNWVILSPHDKWQCHCAETHKRLCAVMHMQSQNTNANVPTHTHTWLKARQCHKKTILITMLWLRRCHWLVQITYSMLGGDLIRTEWVYNTSPSSSLIKLPSYYFIWITARTRLLSNPHYKSWSKTGANWVKWIIWTRASIWIRFR